MLNVKRATTTNHTSFAHLEPENLFSKENVRKGYYEVDF